MTLTQITEKGIKDGEIIDADINASAAISGSKINPTFGSQNIATTGTITASGTIHSTLLSSSQTSTGGLLKLARTGTANGEYQFRMSNDSGNDCNLRIYDVKASATRFTIDSNGTVDVAGNLDIGAGVDVTGAITGTGDLTIDTNTLHVDSSNNRIGIGTATPADLLHCVSSDFSLAKFESTSAGDTGPTMILYHNSASPADNDFVGALYFHGNHSGGSVHNYSYIAAQSLDVTDGTEDSNLIFATSVAGATGERMRINGSNVGIGTSSPSSNLHIASSLATIRLEDSDVAAGASYALITSSSNGNIEFSADPDDNRSSSDFRFKIDGGEVLRIDDSGNVGIGNANPSSFHSSGQNLVVGTGSGEEGMTIFSGTGSGGVINFADGTTTSDSYEGRIIYNHSDNSMRFHVNDGGERIRIDSSGNVGINRDSPSCKLEVADTTGSISATKVLCAEFRRDDGTRNPRLQIQHNEDGTFLNHTYSTGAANLMFGIGGTEELRITGDGIKFNGDTAAANALNDYEEGTWTPELTSGYYSGETYSAQTGTYVKIGNQVTAWFFIQFNSMSTSGGEININTPFTAMTGSLHKGSGIVNYHNFSNSSTSRTLAIYQKNSTTMKFYGGGDNLFSATAHTSQNGKYLIGHFTFRTA